MASLDFVYDITEKLDQEQLNYLVLTIREGTKENKVDVFFHINKEAEDTFNKSIEKVKDIIASREDDDTPPVKPKRRKRRKKE